MSIGYVLDHHVQLSETFVREEIRELRRRGVDVEVLALAPGDTAPGPDEPAMLLRRDFPSPRGPVDVLRHVRSLARPGRLRVLRRRAAALPDEGVPWRRLPVIADELGRRGVTHLHAHFGWRAAAVAAGLAPLVGVPWSMTLHARDMFADARHLEEKLALVDHLVTVCDYNLDWLRARHAPLPPTTIAVCGVRVPDAVVPEDDRDVDVVLVGRLVEKKGVDLLVAATAILRDEWPGLRVQVVGDGPLRHDLEAEVDARGLRDTIDLLGALPHDAALSRLAHARVACLPARIAGDGDRDSMPVVLKEAMARGVPVVGTDLVGIPEMVDDTVGRLVPAEDPGALAVAVAELLRDRGLRERLGRNGRARVRERFTIGRQVDAVLRAFGQG